MATIDHVTIRVADVSASLAFYARAFELLGLDAVRFSSDGFHEWNDFSIAGTSADRPPTTGLHVGLAATSREQVDAWWRALRLAGHPDLGEPGPRPQYRPTYYGGFVADPDGNSIEAVHHESTEQESGVIDHLWIRVADLAATAAFYEPVAEALGIDYRRLPDRVRLLTSSGSCSFVAGEPTRNVHLAFGVADVATVEAFHAAGLAADGVDNGGPGERTEYHPGYHGAFVLDPDGNNVEAVFHDRTHGAV